MPPARKSTVDRVWENDTWTVGYGRLIPGRGRPRKQTRLFSAAGERLPIESLDAVRKDLRERGLGEEGVYVAHDSMGYARYVGRGRIFARLKARAKANKLEVKYFPSMSCRRRFMNEKLKRSSFASPLLCCSLTNARRGSISAQATFVTTNPEPSSTRGTIGADVRQRPVDDLRSNSALEPTAPLRIAAAQRQDRSADQSCEGRIRC